jgi:dienelactone hydrolase
MRIAALPLLLILSLPALAAQDSTRRGVMVTATDGIHLGGDFYAAGKSGPGVLIFHQCSRDRLIWERFAASLAASGRHVLVLNPRGIGDSQGEQWDYDGSLDHALDYWRRNWSADAESAYQWLISQPGVEKDNVVTAGAGCGAFLALLTAQRHYPTVRTAVFFSDFVDEATRKFLASAPQLAILSAVSEQDPMSFASAKEIHQLSHNAANRLLTYPEQAHGFRLMENHPELAPTAIKWLAAQRPVR